MESGQRIEYIVPKLSQSIRLDKWLLDEGPNSGQSGQRILSRTQITKLIDSGDIRVNGAAVKKSYKVRKGIIVNVSTLPTEFLSYSFVINSSQARSKFMGKLFSVWFSGPKFPQLF